MSGGPWKPKAGVDPFGGFRLFLGVYLRSYQRKWVNDRSRFRIWLKARQTGATSTVALEAVLGCLEWGEDTLLVSSSERNAQEVLDRCYRWVDGLRGGGHKIKLVTHSRSEIRFENGAKVLSLAQNPNTVRGFTGSVVLDEFAHHPLGEEIYEAILPVITLGGRLSVVSTPLGQSGPFWQIWSRQDTYRDYARHRVDINQAIKAGLRVDVEFLKRNMDEESFRQEYLCEFIDESSAFFPFVTIRGCVGEGVPDNGQNFLGVDVGRKHDRTVIYVLRKLEGRFFTVAIELLKGKEFEVQRSFIRDVVKRWNVVRGQVDATGIGRQLAEELHKEFPFVKPVPFSDHAKERMVVGVKRLFEEKKIQIPDDPGLIGDIHAIRKSVTASQRIVFDVESSSSGHADRFWALALAVDAAQVLQPVIEIH